MKRRTGIIIGVVALVAAAAFFLVRAAEDRVTADMLSRADRLAIPSDWKKTVDIVRGEQFLCLDTNPCPSIARQWDSGAKLATADLQAVVAPAGLTLKIDGTCQRKPNESGTIPVCTGTGTDGDYNYIVGIVSASQSEPDIFTLEVRPVP
ncbi:hypothetical protein [Arthrobacter sp. NicSoilB8]|uniref:hypothetical protein n=1 Tax=Arthrobacter sp. NicSoilB8 TaxID=2830998 RepID=UPI001CC6F933|nr:hypothetical protein [Arthrobacter sp. NicSoilB8]